MTPAPSPSQVASPVATPSDALVAGADGLTLSVKLDHLVVAPGEIATFTVTLTNGSATPVDYQVPWCGGGATVVLTVALPQGPSGKTWSGSAQTFKDFVLTQGLGPGGGPLTSPVRINAVAEPCGNGDAEAILAPGASVTSSLPWKAEIVAGVGALEGTVPFTVSAAYDRQDDPATVPPPPAVAGMVAPIYKHLVVSGALEIVGSGPMLVGPGEAVDAVLADKTYAKWLDDQPRATWSNVNLFLAAGRTDGFPPTAPTWQLDFFVETGVPRHFALAFVDPLDASLLLAQYCDVPCVE